MPGLWSGHQIDSHRSFFLLYFRTVPASVQTQPHASPTTQAQQGTVNPSPSTQATATPSAQTPQDLYTQVTQGTPLLDDPLSTNGTYTLITSVDNTGTRDYVLRKGDTVNIESLNAEFLMDEIYERIRFKQK